MSKQMTPDAAAAARIETLNAARSAISTVFSEENLGGIDALIKREQRTIGDTEKACWKLVQQIRDLKVPEKDAGVTSVIRTALREHAVSAFPNWNPKGSEKGSTNPKFDPAHGAAVIRWADWSKCIQRAVFFGLDRDKFRVSLKNDPAYRLDEKGGSGDSPAAAGPVQTTTLHSAFVTASKLLRQLRLLNQLGVAGGLLDLLVEHYPEFQELGDDGKPVQSSVK